jgi:hypothetical protein
LRAADHVDENRDLVNEFSVPRATPKRTMETNPGTGQRLKRDRQIAETLAGDVIANA